MWATYNFQWRLIVGLKTCTDMQFILATVIFGLEIRMPNIAFNLWWSIEPSFTVLSWCLLSWEQAQCASYCTENIVVVVCSEELNTYLASSCSRIPLIADEWGPLWFTCTKRQKNWILFLIKNNISNKVKYIKKKPCILTYIWGMMFCWEFNALKS